MLCLGGYGIDVRVCDRYRPQPLGWDYEDDAANSGSETIPQLGGKHKFHVFKARSKLERDASPETKTEAEKAKRRSEREGKDWKETAKRHGV